MQEPAMPLTDRIPFEPVPLWTWNERMDPDAVASQNQALWNASFAGGFIHVRTGLLDEYMGPSFLRAVDAVVEDCRRTGRPLWVYDEHMYPSGFGGGSVPRRGEAFRHKALIARAVGEAPPPGCTTMGPPAHGLQVYRWVASLGNPGFNHACYADTLNPAAVDAFIADCYEPYVRRYGTHGDGRPVVSAFFTDEPVALTHANAPHGAVPWTDALPESFAAEHGYDPAPRLHLLFTEHPDAAPFRLHFYRTVDRLFREHFTQRLARWCEQRGIPFTGHYDCEHLLYKQQLRGVDVMTQYRHMTVPGIDHLGMQVRERLTAKQCQSLVNQFAKPRMMSECGGCGGHGMSFADRWWIVTQQAALGVNWFVPHLSTFSIVGNRKRDWPPTLFEQQPWWPGQAALNRRTARLCAWLSEGRCVADVLVIHPRQSAAMAWTASADEKSPRNIPGPDYEPTAPGVRETILPVQQHLESLCDALLGWHVLFDLGDETTLHESGQVTPQGEPALAVGAMSYRTVVLPLHLTLRQTTIDLLTRFAQRGGRVVASAAPAQVVDGRSQALPPPLRDALHITDPDTLAGELASTRDQPALHTVQPEQRPWVISHQRDLGDGRRRVYVVNLNRLQPATVQLRWRGSGVAHDLDDGGDQPVTAPELTLLPGEDRLLTLSPTPRQAPRAAVTRQRAADLQPVRVTRLDDNALPLDMVQWREGSGDWSGQPVYVLSVQRRLMAIRYRGELAVRYRFVLRELAAQRRLHLVVENAGRYEIAVNGRRVQWNGVDHWRDRRWHPVDIRHAAAPGVNTIELRCPAYDAATMDIDAAMVVGDFAVHASLGPGPTPQGWAQQGLPAPRLHWVGAAALAINDPAPLRLGDLVEQGLPFYAGRVAMEFDEPLQPGDALQCLPIDMAVHELRAGDAAAWQWLPQQPGLRVRHATRGAQVIAYGDLRNLLGPHHNPRGDRHIMPPDEYWMPIAAGWTAADTPLRWAAGECPPVPWQPDYLVRALRLPPLTRLALET
jgi:hypothetical protein